MAASRTGTTNYLRNAARVKRAAQAAGLTHCPMPGCGAILDYHTPRLDNSAEADHIVEARHGGTDHVDNLRVICRRCNRDRNGKGKATPSIAPEADFRTLRQW